MPNPKADALRAQKSILFKELTSLSDDAQKPDLSCARALALQDTAKIIQQEYRTLQSAILEHNASITAKEDHVSIKDFDTFLTLFLTLSQQCYKASTQEPHNQTAAHASHSLSLKAVKLPVFDGDLLHFGTFISLFDSLVDTNSQLSDLNKFHYLLLHTSKEPHSIVSAYELTSSNYAIAYQQLKDRFANKRRLASFHFHLVSSTAGKQRQITSLLETVRTSCSALKSLQLPDLAGFLLFQLVYSNLEPRLQRAFDQQYDKSEAPTDEDVVKFLERHARSEELNLDAGRPPSPRAEKRQDAAWRGEKRSSPKSFLVTQGMQGCAMCGEGHALTKCFKFRVLALQEKLDLVQSDPLICFNCLYKHSTDKCQSKNTCFNCNEKHHTSLCDKALGQTKTVRCAVVKRTPQHRTSTRIQGMSSGPCSTLTRVMTRTRSSLDSTQTESPTHLHLMQTIAARCHDSFNQPSFPVRVLLDSGSEINLITKRLAQNLGLMKYPIKKESLLFEGICQTSLSATAMVDFTISSPKNSQIQFTSTAYVVKQICGLTPSRPLTSLQEQFRHLDLADSEFYSPGTVGMLLGVKACNSLMSIDSPNVIKPQAGDVTAIKTTFGWVLSGGCGEDELPKVLLTTTQADNKPDLEKFWEIEALDPSNGENLQEVDFCEQHYRETFVRRSDGCYSVSHPFKPGTEPDLLFNRKAAFATYKSLQRRMGTNPQLSAAVVEFMELLLKEHRMSVAPTPSKYLLPFFSVSKRDSTTTPYRCVFNASARDTTRGLSMNDLLCTGPNLQADIAAILTAVRTKPILMFADIKGMYPSIYINPEHRQYQHILYQPADTRTISEYQIERLIYGFADAPWLAMRTLRQLVIDEQLGQDVADLVNGAYMDDFTFAVSTVQEARDIRDRLIAGLARGGFLLRKWGSSHSDTLSDLPVELTEKPLSFLNSDSAYKLLGLIYDPTSDVFRYHIPELTTKPPVTKRLLAREIARCWDVLGFLAPVTFSAKCAMQEAWKAQSGWDEEVSPHIAAWFQQFVTQVPSLASVSIPRYVNSTPDNRLSLFGACDASSLGYAAVIYLHVESSHGTQGFMLKSKTRVAPLKTTMTIPRLELLGCLLLAQLLDSLLAPLASLNIAAIRLYSDSQVALCWLHRCPADTFVANRVQQVRALTSDCCWGYIHSKDNPADVASRGITPAGLLDHSLWWEGPPFLKGSVESWPAASLLLAQPRVAAVIQIVQEEKPFFHKFSSLSRLCRVTAYVLRFISNTRRVSKARTGPLQHDELDAAMTTLIKWEQAQHFKEDLKALKAKKLASPKLRQLFPYVDDKGVLRVGGRLVYATLSQQAKHPVIIPKVGILAPLLCDYYHHILLHSGPRTTRAFLNRKYWIIGANGLVRKKIRQCVTCHKMDASPIQYKMAPLPPSRLQAVRPFYRCQMDLAGPIKLKETLLRKSREFKAYILVVVCQTTRAVYLDCVSDLSTEAFLAAFTRFSSRRGLPFEVFTDNATNFKGASNNFKSCQHFFTQHKEEIFVALGVQEIHFKFNVPLAPHMGGLHEAAVKSMKRLLYKQVGNRCLSWEQMSTVLARCEAALNSRPLGSLEEDPEGWDYLSPAHFLVGGPMLASPEKIEENNMSHAARWRLVRQISQHLWTRWSQEYVSTLMSAKKWHRAASPLELGTVVYLADFPSAPLSWCIGRVEGVYKGRDGVERAALVKTTSGSYLRPLTKIITLPKVA